jgi:phage-related protein
LTQRPNSGTITGVRAAIFHRAAREAIRSFPADVRQSLGKAIWELQKGVRLTMPLSKSIPGVAAGVEELRIKDRSGAYRAFYYVRSEYGVLVFHAFMKKSQKTPQAELKIGQRRLTELLNEQAQIHRDTDRR